jgi:hypothetical protein
MARTNFPQIERKVAKVVGIHDEHEKAKEAKIQTEADLLTELIGLMRPALSDLSSKLGNEGARGFLLGRVEDTAFYVLEDGRFAKLASGDRFKLEACTAHEVIEELSIEDLVRRIETELDAQLAGNARKRAKQIQAEAELLQAITIYVKAAATLLNSKPRSA